MYEWMAAYILWLEIMAVMSITCQLGKKKNLSATCKFISSKAPLWVRVSNCEVLEVCFKLPAKGLPAVAYD